MSPQLGFGATSGLFRDPTIHLEDAIRVAREIEGILSVAGFHVGLTGSTLYYGHSQKDIDLIVYSHDNTLIEDPTEVIRHIADKWTMPVPNEYEGDRTIYKIKYDDYPVDLFFMS